MTREAVATLTPALAATSRIVVTRVASDGPPDASAASSNDAVTG